MARFPLPPAEPMRLVSLAEIARGGMGSVELARVEGGKFNGNLLAIKRLHPNIAQDPQFVGMFLDEAWMTAALKSPNVVQVAAWGNDDKGMFLAVEFVQGVSLSRLIKESQTNQEPFAERTVANIGSQICAGLVAAHGLRGPDNALLGLVHRDLTPGNILVSFEGVVKIADFGIAKAEERITHTRTGTLKGKPSYMAPEQARGGKVDARSDLFSFGVLMFELLAGRRPWAAKSAFDVMMDIATTPAPDLRELRKGVNPTFVEIVEKCLQKKPDDRFATAVEIQQRLDAWRQQKNFVHDDLRSLGHFVVRNSAAQIKWFEEAMHGEMQRAQKLSFKELEEQIDLERETTAARRGNRRAITGQPPHSEDPIASPRASSPHGPGAEFLPSPSKMSMASSQPVGAGGSGQYGALPSPSRGQEPYPANHPGNALAGRDGPARQSSGNHPAVRPSSAGAMPAVRPSGQSGSSMAAVQPPSASGYAAPSSHGSGPQSPLQKNLGGTEFMAQSPFGTPPPQAAPSMSGATDPLRGPPKPISAGTMLMPAAPDPRASHPGRPVQAASPPERNAPAASPSPAPLKPHQVEATVLDPSLLGQLADRNAAREAAARDAAARDAAARDAAARDAALRGNASREAAARSERRSGGGVIWVLLVLAILGAGGAAAWYYRAQIAPAQFGPKRHAD